MKKKSGSQSAFFRLRILVGHFLALVGVFLALFATSANILYRPAGSEPVISVTPESLSVTLQQGQTQIQTLTIANLGGTTLEWDQFGGTGCVLGQWVGAQPFGGSILPGQSQQVTVTFNATNVFPSNYTATLCLTHNDPVRPQVKVPLALTVTPATGVHVLFNQLTGNTSGSVPAHRFVPPGPSDAEAADDFMVFDPEGWTISQFNFEAGAASEPMVDIRVYPDDKGQPGEPALCSYNGIGTTLHGVIGGRLRVPLPTPCVLGQGRYWVSLVRSDGPGMGWNAGTPNPFPPPFILGAHGHWRNPGNGYETGCTDWSDITTCLVKGEKEPVPIGGSGGTDLKFQICGAIGAGGKAVGCGDDNAAINLATTLAVDNGDPNQCGTATTLEVDAGNRINVCHTVTNTGNTPLGFHWLRDNLNTRRLSRGITSVLPGESFRFNRRITATRSQAITAESQATDVIPWYFAQFRASTSSRSPARALRSVWRTMDRLT